MEPHSWNSSHRSALVETSRPRVVSMLEGEDRKTLSMLVDLQMAREHQQQQRARSGFLLPSMSTGPVSDELLSPEPNSDAPPSPYTPSESGQHTPRRRSAVRTRKNSTILNFENTLFSMVSQGRDTVPLDRLLTTLESNGLRLTDPRLRDCMRNLHDLQRTWDFRQRPGGVVLDKDSFRVCVASCAMLVQRALQNEFVIPDFADFCADVEKIYSECKTNTNGKPANYIPQLAKYSAANFGMALCTVNGQRFSVGETDTPFTIQSASKPLNYAIAHHECGEEYVHRFVGHEPSGVAFNKLCLNLERKPHNPMINSGAITVVSLLQRKQKLADRFDHIIKKYRSMAGGEYVGFNNAVFLSERETADRNFSIGYYLKEYQCFPPGTSLHETMDLYFQLCSVEVTCEAGAVIAATLANGGYCPVTGERVVHAEAVRDTLGLMFSCGMYDYSGEFAFRVGLPAKSGVSGVVLLVVPNLLGLCVWSPCIDTIGNSVRGIQFCQSLVDMYAFHAFDTCSFKKEHKAKKDPRASPMLSSEQQIEEAIYAAAHGDLEQIRRAFLRGVNLNGHDYDHRTALHLAAAEGHLQVCKFLVERCGVNPEMSDRWGYRPLDEAERFGQTSVVAYLRARAAQQLTKLEEADKANGNCDSSPEEETAAACSSRVVRINRELSHASDSAQSNSEVSPPVPPLAALESSLIQLNPHKHDVLEGLTLSQTSASEEVSTSTNSIAEFKSDGLTEINPSYEPQQENNVELNNDIQIRDIPSTTTPQQ